MFLRLSGAERKRNPRQPIRKLHQVSTEVECQSKVKTEPPFSCWSPENLLLWSEGNKYNKDLIGVIEQRVPFTSKVSLESKGDKTLRT